MITSAAIATLALALPQGGEQENAPPAERRDWLAAAVDAGRWLRSVAVETEPGRVGWRADPASAGELDRSSYAGSAGVICFLVELATWSGDEAWLELAEQAGEELAVTAAEEKDFGLWTGLAGEVFALERLARARGDERFAAAAVRGLDRLHAAAGSAGESASFGALTDVIAGDAGVGFLLLHTARELDRPADLALAERLGRHLVAVGTSTADGVDWPMQLGEERRMPGFSHGTAGIAAFLCELYRASARREFLDAAIAGASHLLAIADTADGKLRVAHHFPGGESLYYLGWCHGPAGTVRLFRALQRASEDERWSETEARLVRTLLQSGLPEARPDGYWNNVGRCCGAAGIVHALLAGAPGSPGGPGGVASPELALAVALGEDMLCRARREGVGLCWAQAEHRVRPELVVVQTGYMQGAAGAGMALLELHARERGRALELRFPDDPR